MLTYRKSFCQGYKGQTMRLSFPACCLLGAAFCFSLIAIAISLEVFAHFEPCPLCLLQRYVFGAIGLLFLIAAIHAPTGRGRYGYGSLLLITISIGLAIAGRHVWLVNLPLDEQPPCGPSLAFLMNNYPLLDALRFILKGTADCGQAGKPFLGLSLPVWALGSFGSLFLYVLIILRLKRPT